MNLVVLALVPTLLSAPPPTSKRMAVLLVPMDQGAEAATVKLEAYMNEALEQYPSLQIKKTDELFGLPADDEAEASLKRAEKGFDESRAAFDSRNAEEAERKLRATIKEFSKSAAAMKSCGHFCDAIALYGATLLQRGDAEEAKIAVLDLVALADTYELDRKKFTQDFISLRTQVATSRNAQLRGNIAVKTKPAGARVYLDGEFQGYSPMTLQTLKIGKHLVRLERPGCKVWGSVVEVTPEESVLNPELAATAAYKAYDSTLDKLAGEVTKDKGGGTMSSLAKTLGVDRAIVGLVKEINESGGTEMNIALFELKSGKKVAGKKVIFQGDEYGQLKSEVGRVVNFLLNAEGGEKIVKTADPLQGRSGTEDWSGEERGGAKKDKKKKGDPLDGVNGTEDW
jgi:hypothetical protein